MTDRVAEAWDFYDALLEKRIAEISELSGVPCEQFVKINPADFVEKTKFQTIRGYEYKKVKDFILKEKKDDKTFLVSPMDAVAETAAQVSYKAGTEIKRTIRASKCEILPVHPELAQDFFIRNHRQSAPHISAAAVIYGLVFRCELVAVMFYDISFGAIRGRKKEYELVRLAIAKGARIHGAASKLQNACEDTLREMGQTRIYSYSNATLNSGAVYEKLGFRMKNIDGGCPFVILKDNSLQRLAHFVPFASDENLALRGHLKTHLGGNKLWIKEIL